MSYTKCQIDTADMWVDPDTMSLSIRPYTQIEPALDGTQFVHYLQTNPYNPAALEEVSVGGVYIDLTVLGLLQGFIRTQKVVTITGTPGIKDTDEFVIMSLTHNPIKPAVLFPGESETPTTPPIDATALAFTRFSYNMTLTRVGAGT